MPRRFRRRRRRRRPIWRTRLETDGPTVGDVLSRGGRHYAPSRDRVRRFHADGEYDVRSEYTTTRPTPSPSRPSPYRGSPVWNPFGVINVKDRDAIKRTHARTHARAEGELLIIFSRPSVFCVASPSFRVHRFPPFFFPHVFFFTRPSPGPYPPPGGL